MNKTLTALLFASFCSVAAAQTGGLPPEQAPAGNPGRLKTPTQIKAEKPTPAPAVDAAVVEKPSTAASRRAARKAKRAAKVGPKPID